MAVLLQEFEEIVAHSSGSFPLFLRAWRSKGGQLRAFTPQGFSCTVLSFCTQRVELQQEPSGDSAINPGGTAELVTFRCY